MIDPLRPPTSFVLPREGLASFVKKGFRKIVRRVSAHRNQALFNEYIAAAKVLKKENPGALKDLMTALGKKVQTDLIIKCLQNNVKREDEPFLPQEYLFSDFDITINDAGNTLRELKVRKFGGKKKLSDVIILPWPWNRERLLDCMAFIGPDEGRRKWEQDKMNHRLELWQPLNIVWISGGNHSIATGVIQGQGEVEIDDIYDISSYYEHVYCDGLNYRLNNSGEKIANVANVELAAIYEIGHMIISPDY